MRQDCPEEPENPEKLECFAVAYKNGTCCTCIKFHNGAFLRTFYACNLRATVFDTLEELAVNLELKFPRCLLDIDASSAHHQWSSCAYEIKGVSQEVLRECLQNGRCLL